MSRCELVANGELIVATLPAIERSGIQGDSDDGAAPGFDRNDSGGDGSSGRSESAGAGGKAGVEESEAPGARVVRHLPAQVTPVKHATPYWGCWRSWRLLSPSKDAAARQRLTQVLRRELT